MTGPAHRASQARPKITLERAYPAAIDRVWELWTTRDGIESWWGPEGFEVEVRRLDLRPGGELLYAMRAVGPDQIEFMNKAGMPLLDEHRVLYMQVEPPRRLVYKDVADFIPGVKPYEVETTVELEQVAVRERRDEVQVREEADSRRVHVRDAREPGGESERGDAAARGDAARPDDV